MRPLGCLNSALKAGLENKHAPEHPENLRLSRPSCPCPQTRCSVTWGVPDSPGSPWEGRGVDGSQLDPGFGRRTQGGIQDNSAEPARPLPASFEDLRGPPLVWLLCGQVLVFPMAPVYHPSLLPDLQSAPDLSTSRAEKYEPDLGHIRRFERFVASVTPSQVTREAGGPACASHASEARAAYRSDCFEMRAVTRDSEFHGLDSEAGGRSLSSRVVET